MDEQLKRRLLGAGILTVFAAVIVPYFFEDKTPKTSTELPLPSEAKDLVLPKAEEPVAEKSIPESAPPSQTPSKKRAYTIVPLEEPKAGVSAPAVADEEAPASVAEERVEEPASVDRAPVIVDPKAPAPKAVLTPKLQHPATDVPPARVATTPQEAPKVQAKKTEPPKVAKPQSPPQALSTPSKKVAVTEPEKKAPATSSSTAPSAKSSAPTSYLVQAGTFSDENNAKTLVDKLKKRSLPARLQVVEGLNGKVYRVTVGPNLDRARAEQIQKQLADQDGVRGLILQGH